ncbi:MAG: hypothetical protein HQ582_22580, partial [Planctomycetes bacterium]|nr:hypothetical protein [Planctomycetota bacterium]
YMEGIRSAVEQDMAREAQMEEEPEQTGLPEEEMESDWLEAEMDDASES